MKLATIICVVFFASASHAILFKTLKRQWIMSTVGPVTDAVSNMGKSFIDLSNNTFAAIDKEIEKKLNIVMDKIIKDMNETANGAKGKIDAALMTAAIDEGRKKICNTEKMKLDDQMNKANATLRKCIVDKANITAGITKLVMETIGKMSNLSKEAVNCASDKLLFNFLSALWCGKEVQLKALDLVWKSSLELKIKNEEIITSLLNLDAKIKECKDGDNGYKEFLELASAEEKCVEKKN